jgi:hypothetical protein
VVKVSNLDTTASPWPQGPVLKTVDGGNFLFSHGHIIEIPRVKLMQLLYNVKDTTKYQTSPAYAFYSDTSVTVDYPLGKRNTGCGTGVGLGLLPPMFFKAMAMRKRRKKMVNKS